MKRPGFISALNAAIAAGFVLSYVVPQDQLMAWILGGKDALGFIADADRRKLDLVLQYGATSAIALFFVRRLPLSHPQSATLFVCNALLATSVWLRYWLATQDYAVLKQTLGGDVGWAVALSSGALAVIELAPAAVIFAVLVVAVERRFREPKPADGDAGGRRWLAAAQIGVVALAGIAPVAYWAVKLGSGADSPRAKGRAKAERFEALCNLVSIDIRRRVSDAKGVVFLRPLGAQVGLLKRLQIVEVELDQPRLGMRYLEYSRAGKTPLYVDHQFTGGEGPVPEPRSEYEVSRKRLEDRSAPTYAFYSAEETIRDRRTGEMLASYSYVQEDGNGPRRFCPRGFDGSEFRSHIVFYVFSAMELEKASWMEEQLADFRRKASTR